MMSTHAVFGRPQLRTLSARRWRCAHAIRDRARLRAARAIAAKVQRGELAPDDIDEVTIADNLYTAGLPDPDLLIRTAGEFRISNYLLWQISYAEIHVSDVCWPEFGAAELHAAFQAYGRRVRTFGKVL